MRPLVDIIYDSNINKIMITCKIPFPRNIAVEKIDDNTCNYAVLCTKHTRGKKLC